MGEEKGNSWVTSRSGKREVESSDGKVGSLKEVTKEDQTICIQNKM